jgi:hypothetical protein
MELRSAGAPLLADVEAGVLPVLVPAPEVPEPPVPESGAPVLVGYPVLDGDPVLDGAVLDVALMALFWRS